MKRQLLFLVGVLMLAVSMLALNSTPPLDGDPFPPCLPGACAH